MNILLDLDGTLIDSSPSILKSVERAFQQLEIDMLLPLDKELIGPPLDELLKMLSGSDDKELLQSLAMTFKESYDSKGYKETVVFEGVPAFLDSLNHSGHRLFIVTNKRKTPTLKILEYFNWRRFFAGVYTLDDCEQAQNKSELIAHVLADNQLISEECIYVGDTVADARSAKANQMRFIMVSWGYDFNSSHEFVESVEHLSDCLSAACNVD